MSDTEILELIILSKKVHNSFEEKVSTWAKEYSLSKIEAETLVFLYYFPEKNRACDITFQRGFSKGHISKAINSLLEKKLITISLDGTDRRYQHIIIKDNAKSFIEGINALRKDYFLSLKEGLTDEEIETLLKIIRKITQNMQKKEGK